MSKKGIIRPCPFCNGDAGLCSTYSGRIRKYFIFVKCEMCGAQGKAFSDVDDPDLCNWDNDNCNRAINAWNLRVNER